MPFKSKEQEIFLRINEPKVYETFKNEQIGNATALKKNKSRKNVLKEFIDKEQDEIAFRNNRSRKRIYRPPVRGS